MNPPALLSDHISVNDEEKEKKICGICALLCFPKLPEKCVSANRRVQCFSNCPYISSPLLKYLIFSCRQIDSFKTQDCWLISGSPPTTIFIIFENICQREAGAIGVLRETGLPFSVTHSQCTQQCTVAIQRVKSLWQNIVMQSDTIQYDNIRFLHYTIYNMLWNILWQFAKTITALDCVNSVLHNIAANSPFYQVLSLCRVCVYLVFESCISLPAAYMFR